MVPSFPSLPSTRPWDPLNDLIQFETDGCIQTKVRHRTPMVRSGSLISLSNQGPRRDNCKYQVGHPGQRALVYSAAFHAAAAAASSSSPLPPLLPLPLFTGSCPLPEDPITSFLCLIWTRLPVASRVFALEKIRNPEELIAFLESVSLSWKHLVNFPIEFVIN